MRSLAQASMLALVLGACEKSATNVVPSTWPIDALSGERPLIAVRQAGGWSGTPGDGTIWALWRDGSGLVRIPFSDLDTPLRAFSLSTDDAYFVASDLESALTPYRDTTADLWPVDTRSTTVWIADGTEHGLDVTTFLGVDTARLDELSSRPDVVLHKSGTVMLSDAQARREHLARHSEFELQFAALWRDALGRMAECAQHAPAADARTPKIEWRK